MALQDKDTGLERLAQQLIHSTGCKRLVMKLGSEGFIAYDRDHKGELYNQHFQLFQSIPLTLPAQETPFWPLWPWDCPPVIRSCRPLP